MIDKILGDKFKIEERLQSLTMSHQRYRLVSPSGGGPGRRVLSFCEYRTPLRAESLQRQARVADAMKAPPAAELCRLLEWRFDAGFQFAVSEDPGTLTLNHMLRQRQAFDAEEAEAVLSSMVHLLALAAERGWPRIVIDVKHIYFDEETEQLRVPAPDVPVFDPAAVEGAAEMNPFETIAFNPADLLRGDGDPVPSNTRDYVAPLASFACELLGQPQMGRGDRNARFRPVAKLSAHQNAVLREAIAAGSLQPYPSVQAFFDAFSGAGHGHGGDPATGRAPGVTSPGGVVSPATTSVSRPVSRSSSRATFARKDDMGLDELADVTRAHLELVDQIAGAELEEQTASRREGATAPLRIAAAFQGKPAPPCSRLRLLPRDEKDPVLCLIAGDIMTIGRSAGTVDYLVQFRPRSNANDARTRMISRTQMILRRTDDGAAVLVEEPGVENPSLVHGEMLGEPTELELPVMLTLAGECCMELRHFASAYGDPRRRVVQGREVPAGQAQEGAALAGGIVVRTLEVSTLPFCGGWLVSDLALVIPEGGRPGLGESADVEVTGRFHVFDGLLWIEAVSATDPVRAGDAELGPHEMAPLVDGLELSLSGHRYRVQRYGD